MKKCASKTFKNIKCILAYSGTRYFGFQKTKYGPSIEEELERALQQIVQHPISLQAASRTDRGVHAEGQVVNFFLQKEMDLKKLLYSLRCLLPKDISPVSFQEMHPSFHPTLHAQEKEYHYFICNQSYQLPFFRDFSWHIYQPLDMSLMHAAAEMIIGKKNFSALSNLRYENPIRTVKTVAILPLEYGRILVKVTGDHFLYKMVRNIVGTLIYIGLQKIPLEQLPEILAQGKREFSGVTAPAHGLCLKRVFY